MDLRTLQIEFELTNHCNARCIFCPRAGIGQQGYMDFDTLKAGVDLAKASGINCFKISGFGEPTLHRDMIKFLKYIKSEVPDALILLITNGQLLNKKLFDELAGIPVTRINISFNGYDKRSYEKQMKNLSFDKVVENLKYIAAAGKKLPEIQFVPILSKSFTEKDIEKMKSFLSSLGFSQDNFKHRLIITSRLQKIKNKALVDKAFLESLSGHKFKQKGKVICLAAFSTLFIGWNGDIHLCCNDIYGEVIVGRIKELKTSDDLRKLERKILELRSSGKLEICQKCDYPLTRKHIEKDGFTFTEFS